MEHWINYGDSRDEHNRQLIEQATDWELEGPYTNGVVATGLTLAEATQMAREHHHNHMQQGFNLSCDVDIWGVNEHGVRIGALR